MRNAEGGKKEGEKVRKEKGRAKRRGHGAERKEKKMRS
jgi:hypothetical protein